ncbi:response regulator transcription factor [Adhaeribacter sp. BT258]|uniref:Response regulator transcription factor n=1 Tax=Adhaeribacter terrigena TaxID=2793070 RepID=A0ABS1C218_9BACT|nr:response regulator transcription factor [Adhaeribacter terrigena]MBK0403438.1 response regulator transcription factor [Adhaeribacter terrigena]
MKDMTTIGIIEDDTTIREGLRTFLNRQSGFSCTVLVDSIEEFLNLDTEERRVDILLLDIGLPGMSGLDGLRLLKQHLPDTKIIMSTGNEESTYIFRSFNAGANGYLLKNNLFFEVKTAIDSVREGNGYLSPIVTRKVLDFFNAPKHEEIEITSRERQIVQCLVDGLSYKLIADKLDISLDTVRFHLKNLYKKLRVNSKSEVVSKALKTNLINS